jgi:(E)-4-hydroxy-3-methyl-but-2-enyl pyrophosphate reductase
MSKGKQPKVLVARPSGFCFGVERAIKLAKQGKAQHGRVYTLGELVHNPLVLEELEAGGISRVNRPERARDGALVIRAHGCPPSVLARCVELGMKVIDATCPYVRKVQDVARRLTEEGYLVVVVGERNHPEVRSILGQTRGKARVYRPGMRIRARKIGLVCQTTMSRDRLREAVANLSSLRYTELRVFDTICGEVTSRQDAAFRVAHQSELVVVVGGRNSANTSRLAEIVRQAGKRLVFVERAAELAAAASRIRRAKRIGVVAGSSTPDWVVRDVAQRATNLSKEDRR